jgi:hypothetical protein
VNHLALACAMAALATLSPSAAAALEAEAGAARSQPAARVVEIRVNGDAAALARVRMTARELLLRLDVQPNVKAIDEPETSASEPTPLVVAYVDLRNVSAPSIDIEDGQTRQELTRRNLSDVTSLETGVESVLHVLYLAVESTLQVGAQKPPAPAAPPKKPSPPPAAASPAARSPFGFDLGPLVRVSSLGSTRVVPGGGVMLEPRADLGQLQAGLNLSAALHGSSELSFARGEATVRPLQIRVIPTFDWRLSPEVSGCLGLGGGLDSLLVDSVQPPDQGSSPPPQTALDPVLGGLVGARVPLSSRAFLSALASLDYDVAPTTFVAREGMQTRVLLQLPRFRAGFTLALSFTAAGERRFAPGGSEP